MPALLNRFKWVRSSQCKLISRLLFKAYTSSEPPTYINGRMCEPADATGHIRQYMYIVSILYLANSAFLAMGKAIHSCKHVQLWIGLTKAFVTYLSLCCNLPL